MFVEPWDYDVNQLISRVSCSFWSWKKKAGTVGKCDFTTAKIHDKSGFSVVRFEVLQVEHLKNIPKN